ncbi:MAG TPA: quinone-dependent dihydroorotate dehydrogenase [Anaerolineales bacterium]|nr:quinone-dependent dihydroorotate dehydrogenase [Anaerolineales bacterium]
MYPLLRPLLFRLDPEHAHAVSLNAIRLAGRSAVARLLLRLLFDVNDKRLETTAFGLTFRNPVGMAAGYDKNAVGVRGLAALGFGHLELGTVTRFPQVGNPRPRLHRLPEHKAVINSMGFPNDGIDVIERRPWQAPGVRAGMNIGKSKETVIERAADDYVFLLRRVYRRADYVALNVSSPNTLNLRQLQARQHLEGLLKFVAAARDGLPRRVPLLLKLAPDLTEAEIEDALAAATATGIDGLIATNTTISRKGLPSYTVGLQGGVSGRPLTARANAFVSYLARQTSLPIVGVGGILTPDDALARLDAGATLLQIYTGLIYAGPGLVRAINRAILNRNC